MNRAMAIRVGVATLSAGIALGVAAPVVAGATSCSIPPPSCNSHSHGQTFPCPTKPPGPPAVK